MALNYIWIAFFLIGFIVALGQLIFAGNTQIFNDMINSTFASAKTGFEISLGLTGALTLWMGLMKVGEKGGVVSMLGKLFGPFFERLFPELPRGHPAYGSMILNFSANMLGLDNAATPIGLKAMKEMQDANPKKDTASNAQIMFLVLNASGLTIIPVSIMVYRTQLGAANPADIFIPILIATYVATLVALDKCCHSSENKSFRQGDSCLSRRTYGNYCRYNTVFQHASERTDSRCIYICGKLYPFFNNNPLYTSCPC